MDSTAQAMDIKGWPLAVKNYFDELQMEMRRVTWPSRQQVESTTVVVIFTVFAFAAYFFVVDSLVGRGVTKLIGLFAKH